MRKTLMETTVVIGTTRYNVSDIEGARSVDGNLVVDFIGGKSVSFNSVPKQIVTGVVSEINGKVERMKYVGAY